MKFRMQLLKCDKHMIVGAMQEYKKGLIGFQLKMFEIALNKVLDNQEMDGMEFTYIIRALKKYSFQARISKRKIEADCYENLSLWVSKAMERHQKVNGPRLKGVMLKQADLKGVS
jgi:hypothetical protein